MSRQAESGRMSTLRKFREFTPRGHRKPRYRRQALCILVPACLVLALPSALSTDRSWDWVTNVGDLSGDSYDDLLLRVGSSLRALDGTSGSLLWTYPTGSRTASVVELDGKSPKEVLLFEGASSSHPFSVTGGPVSVGGTRTASILSITALSLKTQRVIWNIGHEELSATAGAFVSPFYELGVRAEIAPSSLWAFEVVPDATGNQKPDLLLTYSHLSYSEIGERRSRALSFALVDGPTGATQKSAAMALGDSSRSLPLVKAVPDASGDGLSDLVVLATQEERVFWHDPATEVRASLLYATTHSGHVLWSRSLSVEHDKYYPWEFHALTSMIENDFIIFGQDNIGRAYAGETGLELWSRPVDDISPYESFHPLSDIDGDGVADLIYQDRFFEREVEFSAISGSSAAVIWAPLQMATRAGSDEWFAGIYCETCHTHDYTGDGAGDLLINDYLGAGAGQWQYLLDGKRGSIVWERFISEDEQTVYFSVEVDPLSVNDNNSVDLFSMPEISYGVFQLRVFEGSDNSELWSSEPFDGWDWGLPTSVNASPRPGNEVVLHGDERVRVFSEGEVLWEYTI